MSDFTLKSYLYLLDSLIQLNYSFKAINDFILKSTGYTILLRHDVDAEPQNSLKFAEIQAKRGIQGTYYFRILSEKLDVKYIREIYSLGHEVGYHYEDVSVAVMSKDFKYNWRKDKNAEEELVGKAIKNFKNNLQMLRQIVPVSTICMHGSPLSKWDSRLLWKYYNYHDFGIIVEPYFDICFDEMLYLTDTGRRWDGGTVSVRDKGLRIKETESRKERYEDWVVKPISGSLMNMTTGAIDFQNKFKFNSTSDIWQAADRGNLPNKIMLTFHPQRWADNRWPWVRELIWQNVKNGGKYFLIKMKG
jgi:hypothetical protein